MKLDEALDEIETLVKAVRLTVEREMKRPDISQSEKDELHAHLTNFMSGMDAALQGDSSLASIIEMLGDENQPFDGLLTYENDEDEDEDSLDISDEDEGY